MVSNFVGAVRRQVTQNERDERASGSKSPTQTKRMGLQEMNDEVRKRAGHALIEAEKFTADLVTPPAGNSHVVFQTGVNQSEGTKFLSPSNIENAHTITAPIGSIKEGQGQLRPNIGLWLVR